MTQLSKFGAILNTRWYAAHDPGKIVGTWTEDNSPYELTVPRQLRECIVEMQNHVLELYECVKVQEAEIKRKTEELEEVKKTLSW